MIRILSRRSMWITSSSLCAIEYPSKNSRLSSPVENAGATPDIVFPGLVEAPALWAQGVTGAGVTVAVVVTGAKIAHTGLKTDSARVERVYAFYDAINDLTCDPTKTNTYPMDSHGHGTHVAGTAVNSDVTEAGEADAESEGSDRVVMASERFRR